MAKINHKHKKAAPALKSLVVGCKQALARPLSRIGQIGMLLGIIISAPVHAEYAVYNPALGAPECDNIFPSCDSGNLLEGSGSMFVGERNAPNTGGNCVDGYGNIYHFLDKSIEHISVRHIGQTTVAVDVTFFASGSGGNVLYVSYSEDAENINAPFSPRKIYIPSGGGLRTYSTTFDLPSTSGKFRIRARLGRPADHSTCNGNGAYDVDELVFAGPNPENRIFGDQDGDGFRDWQDHCIFGEPHTEPGDPEHNHVGYLACKNGTAVIGTRDDAVIFDYDEDGRFLSSLDISGYWNPGNSRDCDHSPHGAKKYDQMLNASGALIGLKEYNVEGTRITATLCSTRNLIESFGPDHQCDNANHEPFAIRAIDSMPPGCF